MSTSDYAGWKINADQTSIDAANALYGLKEILKSVGWTISKCGDGVSQYKIDGTDLFTSASVFTNSGSWIIIQQPGGGRQFLLSSNTSAAYCSTSIGFGSGTYNSAPNPPSDAGLIYNGNFLGGYTSYFHCAAQKTSPWGFWCAGYSGTGTSNLLCAWVFDPLVNTNPYDTTDIAAHYVAQNQTSPLSGYPSTSLLSGDLTYTGSIGYGPHAWRARKGQSSIFSPCSMATSYLTIGSSNSSSWVSTLGKMEVYPAIYAFTSSSTNNGYIKGTSSFVHIPCYSGYAGDSSVGNGGVLTGDTLTLVNTKDLLIIGGVALPWNGTTPSSNIGSGNGGTTSQNYTAFDATSSILNNSMLIDIVYNSSNTNSGKPQDLTKKSPWRL
jgi:hypothetical protein